MMTIDQAIQINRANIQLIKDMSDTPRSQTEIQALELSIAALQAARDMLGGTPEEWDQMRAMCRDAINEAQEEHQNAR